MQKISKKYAREHALSPGGSVIWWNDMYNMDQPKRKYFKILCNDRFPAGNVEHW